MSEEQRRRGVDQRTNRIDKQQSEIGHMFFGQHISIYSSFKCSLLFCILSHFVASLFILPTISLLIILHSYTPLLLSLLSIHLRHPLFLSFLIHSSIPPLPPLNPFHYLLPSIHRTRPQSLPLYHSLSPTIPPFSLPLSTPSSHPFPQPLFIPLLSSFSHPFPPSPPPPLLLLPALSVTVKQC